jgi:hypothetical protein
MTPEAQEIATMVRLETILCAARHRSRYNRAQAEYFVENNSVVGITKFPTA